jgi:hypothetical protein
VDLIGIEPMTSSKPRVLQIGILQFKRQSRLPEPLDSELRLWLGDILEDMRSLSLTVFVLWSLVVVSPLSGSAQSASGAVATAEISADLGTCSALITVTGADSKPVYGAKVNTRIRYGLLGVKRLDLEAFTGADGQLKITNLPEVLKKPMYIYIQKDNKQETVEFRPDMRCRATFNVQLK